MMDKQEYLEKKIKPIMENLIFQLVCEKPSEPEKFMIDWLQKTGGYNSNGLTIKEKDELDNLRKEVIKYRQEDIINNNDNNEENTSSEESDEVLDLNPNQKQIKKKIVGRKGISAESYGQFNKKEDFKPRFIQKTENQITRIKGRILQSFLFNNLDPSDINIVIGAMDEKQYSAGEPVIKQGDNGDCLYIVDSGELDCTKRFPDNPNVDKYLKTYHIGEAFGELALLYNAPRAATITAKTDCVLWVLDRDTFNNIVKESARLRREKYEKFLKSVDILSTMDDYEISQVSEALRRCSFNAGEYIIRQGEIGDVFYIIEEGEATAFSNKEPGKTQIPEMNYTKGGYFGELSLIRGQPRAANIRAKTDVKLLSLDRNSFKRVMGPIEDILKRNAEKYKKFVAPK
jgi:cAMP-dependent protein kinase regulator